MCFIFKHGLHIKCLWPCLLYSSDVLLSIFMKNVFYSCCQTSDCLFDLAGTSYIIEAIWKVIDIYSPATTVMEMVTAVKRNIRWKCINKRHFWREKFNQETHYRHLQFSSTALLVSLNGRMFPKCLNQINISMAVLLYTLSYLNYKVMQLHYFERANKLN